MDDRKHVATLIRDWLARERISREQFAFRTKLGKSTVDKLLVGLFSDRTLSVVEAHTGLALRGPIVSPDPGNGTAEAAPRAPEGPSIAVLPFLNMSGDPAQEMFADGIAEDLTTDLSRLRWLLVIARNSSFAYKERAVDVRQIGRDLGVRYLLEGSIRTAGGRIRVSSQLVEAQSGKHIWAERYDRELHDIFAVQDEITRNVVAAIEPHLYSEEGQRAARQPPGSLDAWGLVVRAIGLVHRFGRRTNEEARALLERAIALDPNYARAHAVLAAAVWWATAAGWWPGADRHEGFATALRHAERAVTLDPQEPWARMTLGYCLCETRQFSRALAELRATLDLNPNFALGRTIHGWALILSGQFEAAIEETALALRMSPVDSFAGLYTGLHGLALVSARRFEEALPCLRASVTAFSEYPGHHHTLISCCGHLGRMEEAQNFIAARNRIGPPLRLRDLRDRLAGFAHAETFIEGLVKAGVPE